MNTLYSLEGAALLFSAKGAHTAKLDHLNLVFRAFAVPRVVDGLNNADE